MNLISCDNCGVVLDADKCIFPEDICFEDGSINEDLAIWNGEDYVLKIKCPVCGKDITKFK